MTSVTDGSSTPLPRPAAPAAGIRSAVAAFVRRAGEWLRNERDIRNSARALADLDDHVLADLGISRRHIRHAARHGIFRKQP